MAIDFHVNLLYNTGSTGILWRIPMKQFTKREVRTLYWVLVQYTRECEPRYKTSRLSTKLRKMWSDYEKAI
jgi:hypothetical protein